MSRFDLSSRRQLLESSTLGAAAILALVLFAIVNYFGWKYHGRLDWTRSRIYTLSEKTEKVLAELDRDVEVVVFLTPVEELYDPVQELLARYQAASSRISTRVIDPERNPAEAQSLVDKYQITALNVVVLDSGEDRRVVEGADLAKYDYSGLQFGSGPQLEAFTGEQAFTSAILELSENRKPKVLFTSGHDELRIDDFSPAGLSEAREILGRDNFEVETWASLGQPMIPEGTDMVVIAGPKLRFAEPEVEALRSYLESGGRLLALLDPAFSATGEFGPTGLEGLLADYGVEVGQNIVIDPANPLPFYGAETIFVDEFGDHPVTESLSQARVPVILPLVRSVAEAEAVAGLEIVELLRTTDEGWGETDLSDLSRIEKQDEDLPGPVPLAVAVSVAREEEEPADEGEAALADEPAGETEAAGAGADGSPGARLVVFGDSDFATNGQLLNVGNGPLLANVMNWLVEREALVGIPPKQPEQVRLNLTGSQLRRLTWLVLGLLPALAVASGIAIYLRRRS